MSGQANLFSRFGFQIGPDGKIDTYSRAFFSKFKGRTGPAIPDLADASWADIAITINALIKEFAAQGWIEKGFDADETAFANAIQAVTMIPAAAEWGYAPYEALRDQIMTGAEFIATENAYSAYDSSQWLLEYGEAASAGRIGGASLRLGGLAQPATKPATELQAREPLRRLVRQRPAGRLMRSHARRDATQFGQHAP